jgi:hypothetical protein
MSVFHYCSNFFHDFSCGKSTRVPLFIFEDADKHNKVTEIPDFQRRNSLLSYFYFVIYFFPEMQDYCLPTTKNRGD